MTQENGMAELSDRLKALRQLKEVSSWDLAVIGGGATGLGIALDAAARGHSVVLLEANDFAKGTSSRATKLLHGGVRYLAQGNISLVYEALRERTTILRNAPHLAQKLAFVIPAYRQWDRALYGAGLTAYNVLAGSRSLGRTQWLGRKETILALPTVRRDGLVGGVKYWDAQFDDARLALALARTATAQGALTLNYCSVESLTHVNGKVAGLVCRDKEVGDQYVVNARCVVNATGVWSDSIRRFDLFEVDESFRERVQPSRGAHVVLDKKFLASDQALMVPKTSDGRVLFAIPWQGKLLAGTTDVPVDKSLLDPVPGEDEIDFILRELGGYLEVAPQRSDVLSTWAGFRPLVRPDSTKATKSISREHDIDVSASGLVTVTGGKWTTYRAIAEELVDACVTNNLLSKKGACRTADLQLVGAGSASTIPTLAHYGSDADTVNRLPGADVWLCEGLTESMVRFAARYEFARTVEDVLARRIRLLFLDAQLAKRCAARVAEILHKETGTEPELAKFEVLAAQYSGS